jgi:hypothetical protein
VIDPVVGFSTFLGGTAADYIRDVATDSQGNCYAVGGTASADFPTSPSSAASPGGDAFVAKFLPDGTLAFSALIGGSLSEGANGVAVDGQNSIYVVGGTNSTDFPLHNPIQAVRRGTNDAFVLKMPSDGSALTYSTYLGGTSSDAAVDVALDTQGRPVVVGTSSSDFPWNPVVVAPDDFFFLQFVARLNSAGSALECAFPVSIAHPSLAVDQADGAIYLTGGASQFTPITQNALDPTFNGIQDAVLLKFTAEGAVTYGTYLGGSGEERALGIALAPDRSVYITGITGSNDFPQVAPLQSRGGAWDTYIAQVNQAGNSLLFSTYLGGQGFESFQFSWSGTPGAIAVGPDGSVYVVGTTESDDFPMLDPYPSDYSYRACYITKLNAAHTPVYSTILIGHISGEARPFAVAVDAGGSAYLGGLAYEGYVTVQPWQPHEAGQGDGFVTRVSDGPSPVGPPKSPTLLDAKTVDASHIDLTWTDRANNETGFIIYRKTTGDFAQVGTSPADVTTYHDSGLTRKTHYTYEVRAAGPGGVSKYAPSAQATTRDTLPNSPTSLQAVALDDTHVQLTWVDGSDNELSFEIQRKTTGDWTDSGFTDANHTTWTDSFDVHGATQYSYRVMAFGTEGYSDPSNTAQVTTPAAAKGKISYAKSVKFPDTKVGKTRSKTLVVKNASATEKLRFQVVSFSEPFSIDDDGTPVLLPPNGTRTLTLGFAPFTKGKRTAHLTLTTSDPANPNVSITVTGKGK